MNNAGAYNKSNHYLFGDAPLRITTIIDHPFLFWKYGHEHLEGNDRFDGFLVDFIKELAKRMNFNYELHLVADGKYGVRADNGSWNGMVRELIHDEADICLAGLTISSVREEVIDFSAPYMFLGTDILMRKPELAPPNPFSFLSPLSTEMWICVGGAIIVFSLLLTFINRISPYEAHHLSRRTDMSENEATNLNALNSLWFVFSAFVQQGSQFSPLSLSGRIMSGTWWFFVLIFIASYTANMAAFLTVKKLESPVNTVDDLAQQTEVEYGCTESSQTMSFFRDSGIEPYKTMWTYMTLTEPNPFPPTNEEGVQRVCEQNYAFLQDSTFNAYFTNKNPIPNCELIVLGIPFDSKGYGLAFQRGAPYRDDFSQNILELREQGFILELKTSWWLTVSTGTDDGTITGANNVLQLSNIAGIFYLLAGGAVVGLLVALVEIIVYKSKKSKRDKRKIQENGQRETVPDHNQGTFNLRGDIPRYRVTRSVTRQSCDDRYVLSFDDLKRQHVSPESSPEVQGTRNQQIWRENFYF
ncbi:glutamate receptor 2-like [Glandiceps talaboti]